MSDTQHFFIAITVILVISICVIVFIVWAADAIIWRYHSDRKHWKLLFEELKDTSNVDFKFGSYNGNPVPDIIDTPSYSIIDLCYQSPEKVKVFVKKERPEIRQHSGSIIQRGCITTDEIAIVKDSHHNEDMKREFLAKANKIGIPIALMKEL